MNTDPGLYARSFADVYDDWYGDLDNPAHLVESFTSRVQRGSTIVEFGSGTGRLATPLCTAGFGVVALDISRVMLRSAPPPVPSVACDITTVALADECADAVLIAYNTLFNLDQVQEQHRCLSEAARILRPGGLLAIEAFVLRSEGSPTSDYGISVREHPADPAGQLVIVTGPPDTDASDAGEADLIHGSHIELLADTTICRPWRLAYQSPAELDAAALASRLRLTERSEDWLGNQFNDESARHVSWYQNF